MEEKLKSFGELLKETLGDRLGGGEEIAPADDPTVLSEADRNAIFEKLAGPKKEEAKTKQVSETSEEITGDENFGSLLEKTIKLRTTEDNTENEQNDKIRESIIGKSKLDMTEELLKRFIR